MSTSRTLVIQSHAQKRVVGWLQVCVQSVRQWAHTCGFDYRFVGDELFAEVPRRYRLNAGTKTPIWADLARLQLAERLLRDHDRVVWLDADVLVFNPSALNIEIESNCGFGREVWVQASDEGRLRVYRNVHNAICVFKRGSVELPFLLQTTRKIIERADPDHISPQMVGPKLLTALNNIAGFDLIDSVGAASPLVLADLETGAGPALERLLGETRGPIAALNLCASLAGDRDWLRVCERLLNFGLPE